MSMPSVALVAETHMMAPQVQQGSRMLFSRVADIARSAGVGDVPVDELTPGDVDRFVAAIPPTNTDATRDKHLRMLHRVLTIGETEGIVIDGHHYGWTARRETVHRVRNHRRGLRIDKKVRPSLSADQVAAMLGVCMARRHQDPYRVVGVTMMTGSRLQEILTLRWREVDRGPRWEPATGAIILDADKCKGVGSQKPKPFCGMVSDLIGEMPPGAELSDNVFRCVSVASVNMALHKLSAQTIGEVLEPHDLRAAFAGLVVSSGIDIVVARDLLGHKSIATTAGYIEQLSTVRRSVEAAARINAIIEKAKP